MEYKATQTTGISEKEMAVLIKVIDSLGDKSILWLLKHIVKEYPIVQVGLFQMMLELKLIKIKESNENGRGSS